MSGWRHSWQTGLLAAMCLAAVYAHGGELSDNQRITSQHLGYDLQYRVYTPDGVNAGQQLPSLYVTDGQRYLGAGGFRQVLDEMIGSGLVKPVVAVFVDSTNPDNPADDRRHSQFMCNQKYAAFFADELVPAINATYPVNPARDERVILGLSFGGLNAACFGIMVPDLFSGIAMQSPASDAHVDVVRALYEESPLLSLQMFLSVGTRNDNLSAIKRFKRSLEDKGYELTYHKVRQGHDWRNWGPLLDDVLLTFYAANPGRD